MSSKKRRTAARPAARRGTARSGQRPRSSAPRGRPQSRFAKTWKAAITSPLVVAVVTVVITAAISVPVTLWTSDHLHQGAANEATVQAEQDAAAAAQSQDAELVDFGLGSAPHSSSPQIVITNRSSGWVRNLTLIIPVPVRQTAEADDSVHISMPNFNAYSGGGNGFQGIEVTANGATFREPLLDIGRAS